MSFMSDQRQAREAKKEWTELSEEDVAYWKPHGEPASIIPTRSSIDSSEQETYPVTLFFRVNVGQSSGSLSDQQPNDYQTIVDKLAFALSYSAPVIKEFALAVDFESVDPETQVESKWTWYLPISEGQWDLEYSRNNPNLLHLIHLGSARTPFGSYIAGMMFTKTGWQADTEQRDSPDVPSSFQVDGSRWDIAHKGRLVIRTVDPAEDPAEEGTTVGYFRARQD